MQNTVIFLDVDDFEENASYYKAARALGLEVVNITPTPIFVRSSPPSMQVQVSRMEREAVLTAIDTIGQERITGVFARSDSTAEIAAQVAALLGRPHSDANAIALCNDKLSCRQHFAEHGMGAVDFEVVTTVSQAAVAARRLGGRVVLKQLSRAGSNGVRICATPEEATHWTRILLSDETQPGQELLLEAFVEGPLFGVDLFDGRAVLVNQIHIARGSAPIIVGVDSPAMLTTAALDKIKEFAEDAVSLVGHVNGPADVECCVVGDTVRLIEINPRTAYLAHLKNRRALGLDFATLCLKFACGIPYSIDEELAPRKNNGAAIRWLLRDGSRIRRIKGVAEVEEMASVEEVVLHRPRFHRSGPNTGSVDRVGHVCAEAATIEEAVFSADLALKRLEMIPESAWRFHFKRLKWRINQRRREWKARLIGLSTVRPSA